MVNFAKAKEILSELKGKYLAIPVIAVVVIAYVVSMFVPASAQSAIVKNCQATYVQDGDVITITLNGCIEPSPSPSPSPSESASPSPSPSPSSSPTPSSSPSSSPTPTPTANTFPNDTNTGIPAGTVLTKQTSSYYIITTPGTIINAWDFPGQVEIRANNVTIQNSRIRCATDNCIHALDGVVGLKLLHDDIGPSSGYYGGAFGVTFACTGTKDACILDGLNIHNISDGLRSDGAYTLKNSYIHNLDMTGDGAHSDGIQTFGGDHVLITHNTIEGGNTSDILVQGGASSDWVIDGNLMLGRKATNGQITSFAIGFDVNSCPRGGCTFVNNVLNRTWEVGPSYTPTIYTSSTWQNNKYQDNGATVPVP